MSLLLYGMETSSARIVSIREVKNGLQCECICVNCKEVLIAKQGPKKEWHFAHVNDKECTWAPEAALHQLAKQIIVKHTYINLPDKEVFHYTSAKVEPWFNQFVPD